MRFLPSQEYSDKILDNSLHISILDLYCKKPLPRRSADSGGVIVIARLKLKPGQKGTKKLVAEYGASLVCVRYRYDEASRARYKTVELIVEKIAWNPPSREFNDNDLVPVRFKYGENALKELANAAKGRWMPEQKLWLIRYGKIKGTTLEKHIVLDAFPVSEKGKSI